MRIVYAMTRNLYPCFHPTLRSLMEHNDPERVYIMAEDDDLPYPLPDACRVVNVTDWRRILSPSSPNKRSIFTYMAMLRAAYTEIFPDDDKLLQLDIDTIICDDLNPLWDTDLTGKWFGAVREWEGHYRPFGTPQYYNVGVCLYNLAELRKDGVTEQVLNLINTVFYNCTEQDAFNALAVPAGKVVDLPVRFNESFCCGRTDNPAIVHYAGYSDWWTRKDMPRREYLEKYL